MTNQPTRPQSPDQRTCTCTTTDAYRQLDRACVAHGDAAEQQRRGAA